MNQLVVLFLVARLIQRCFVVFREKKETVGGNAPRKVIKDEFLLYGEIPALPHVTAATSENCHSHEVLHLQPFVQ